MEHPRTELRPDDGSVAPTVRLAVNAISGATLLADRFEIVALLGQGGMGAVYRAIDRELGEEVALKVLRLDLASDDAALNRFRREVKLARRVTHSNVARTYDLGRHSGDSGELRFLTMELIEGDALSKRAGGGKRLPISEALRIAGDIARGLAAAHSVGVVHRDLKPDNVMLTRDRVVITDFGIARRSDSHPGARHTAHPTHGLVMGTPAYMAPEQVEGREVDGRADVFALGVVLFEMLTGTLPFRGDSVFTLAAARLAGTTPDPRAFEPDLPETVVALVQDALARRREDRPDAQQILQRIGVLRGGAREIVEPVPRSGLLESLVSPTALSRSVTPSGPRTVAIAPLVGVDATSVGIGNELTAALSDAVSKLRGIRVLSSGVVRAFAASATEGGVLDAQVLGRAVHADWVVDGSARVLGEKVRVRVRLVDVSSGVQTWAERFEEGAGDLFALEDRLVDAVVASLRARVSDTEGRRGPADPAARKAYDEARTSYVRFSQPAVLASIGMLEEALDQHPGDPWLLSAMGAAKTRCWLMSGATDRDLIAQAEEVSLRALAIDPSIGETFNTIGILRLQQGETRAAVHAFQEALQRSPLLAEAHEYMGRLLVESGHVESGLRRLSLATRLDKMSVPPYWERARAFAMQGDLDAAEAEMDRCAELSKSAMTGVFNRVRLAIWFPERSVERARALAAQIDALREDTTGIRAQALPIARALAEGAPLSSVLNIFDLIATASVAAPRQRAFFYQLAAEVFAVAGQRSEAIVAIERAAALPLIDIFWLDACPALASLRDDPAFATARALVAARVAQVWS